MGGVSEEGKGKHAAPSRDLDKNRRGNRGSSFLGLVGGGFPLLNDQKRRKGREKWQGREIKQMAPGKNKNRKIECKHSAKPGKI